MHWRRKWQPTPVFLPGESQGQQEPGGLPSMGSQSWTQLKRLSSSSSKAESKEELKSLSMKVKEESEKDRSAKASILRRSAFFMVQLSHPYMTTGKTIVWLDGPLLAE